MLLAFTHKHTHTHTTHTPTHTHAHTHTKVSESSSTTLPQHVPSKPRRAHLDTVAHTASALGSRCCPALSRLFSPDFFALSTAIADAMRGTSMSPRVPLSSSALTGTRGEEKSALCANPVSATPQSSLARVCRQRGRTRSSVPVEQRRAANTNWVPSLHNPRLPLQHEHHVASACSALDDQPGRLYSTCTAARRLQMHNGTPHRLTRRRAQMRTANLLMCVTWSTLLRSHSGWSAQATLLHVLGGAENCVTRTGHCAWRWQAGALFTHVRAARPHST